MASSHEQLSRVTMARTSFILVSLSRAAGRGCLQADTQPSHLDTSSMSRRRCDLVARLMWHAHAQSMMLDNRSCKHQFRGSCCGCGSSGRSACQNARQGESLNGAEHSLSSSMTRWSQGRTRSRHHWHGGERPLGSITGTHVQVNPL